MSLNVNELYDFEGYRLDVSERVLSRKGKPLRISDKAFDVLSVLVREHGRLVTKDKLLAEVWPNTYVEENNIDKSVSVLRRTFGDRKGDARFIETVRGKGYRFVADVSRVGSDAPKLIMSATRPASSERAGNRYRPQPGGKVVALADWRVPEALPEPTLQKDSAPRPSPLRSSAVVGVAGIAIGAILVLALTTAFFSNRDLQPKDTIAEITIQRLTNGVKALSAAISPKGDYFVYHEIESDRDRMWLQQTGKSDRIEIASTTDSVYSGKTFSPDGRNIYYLAAARTGGDQTLHRIPAIGGAPARVLADVHSPVSFSPDGGQIVFYRHGPGERTSIMIAGADGTGEREIVARESSRAVSSSPAWSPDGKLIAYVETDFEKPEHVGRMTLVGINPSDGSTQSLSSEAWGAINRMAWMPDGKGLVFVGTRPDEGYTTRRDQVYFVSYPEGESRRLTSDGNRHYYDSLGVTDKGDVLALTYSRSSQIKALDLPANEAKDAGALTRGLADGRAGLAPMPDGSVGYIARAGDDLTIWSMASDGTDARQISNDFPVAEELRADPLGRYFVFSAPKDGRSHLYRIDRAGGNLTQLTFGDRKEIDSSISPDGTRVVYDSRSYDDTADRPQLWAVNIDGGEPARFSNLECSRPVYSPNGQFVSCIRREKEILVLSARDGRLIESFRLPLHSIANFGSLWTPDGKGLTYIFTEKGYTNVWVQPLDGGVPHRLTNFSGGDVQRYAFSPDGSRMYVAHGFQVHDVILIKNFR